MSEQANGEPGSEEQRAGWMGAVRDALSGRQRDYTKGPLGRAIALLAIPMVLEMAMESLFAVTAMSP